MCSQGLFAYYSPPSSGRGWGRGFWVYIKTGRDTNKRVNHKVNFDFD